MIDGQGSRNHPCHAVVHVPSESLRDLSPLSVEQDEVPSSMDAPSAPTQKMVGVVSEIRPRKT